MAAYSRPVQYSLAVADLAKHLGGPKLIESLEKPALKELIQIMGILSTETALALLPKLDHAMNLWRTEKLRLRDEVLRGVKPPSLQVGLKDSPVFTESLFPEKVFREFDQKYMESDPTNYFPHYAAGPSTQRTFKRPPTPQGVDTSARKRTKLAPPPAPCRDPRLNKPSGKQSSNPGPSGKQQSGLKPRGGMPQGGKSQGGKSQGNNHNAPNLKKALAAATSGHRPFQGNKQHTQNRQQQQQQQQQQGKSKPNYAKHRSNANN